MPPNLTPRPNSPMELRTHSTNLIILKPPSDFLRHALWVAVRSPCENCTFPHFSQTILWHTEQSPKRRDSLAPQYGHIRLNTPPSATQHSRRTSKMRHGRVPGRVPRSGSRDGLSGIGRLPLLPFLFATGFPNPLSQAVYRTSVPTAPATVLRSATSVAN